MNSRSWTAEEHWTAGQHGMRTRESVQALRGISPTNAFKTENIRFTTFTFTQNVCGADGILAAVQILTLGFSSGMCVAVESGVVALKTTSLPGTEQ
jgi:hypothetical protein